MREQQTNPRQPRDEEGRVRGTDDRQTPQQEQARQDDRENAEGRDRPPSGRNRGPSPWLGGG
jgi:hypothetical protein